MRVGTWHQRQRPIEVQDAQSWTVLTESAQGAGIMRLRTEKDAKIYADNVTRLNPGTSARIIPPSSKKNPARPRAFQSGRKLRVKRSPASEAYRTRLAIDPRRARRVLRKSGYRVNPPRRSGEEKRLMALKVANKIAEISNAVLHGSDRSYVISEVSARLNRSDLTGALSVAWQAGHSLYPTMTPYTLDMAAEDIVTKIGRGYTLRGKLPRTRKNPAHPREIVTITGKRSGRVLAYATPDTSRAELGRSALMLANTHLEPVKIERVKVRARGLPENVRAYLANPAPRESAAVGRAARRFSRFTGHRAERVEMMPFPKAPKAGLAVGPVLMLAYTATRDGKTENYAHKFASHARPMLVASDDGKTLHLIGGRFSFTERGIVDKPK